MDKFLRFAEIAMKSDFQVFLRTDADRLVFSGIDDLIEKFLQDKVDCAEGIGFEFFMNKFRGATPHVFSRKILKLLSEDHSLMPRVQKPECNFINTVVKRGLVTEKTYQILTNLHEYEQYPSKVCNSLVNRISRGHIGYYDMNHLSRLEKYVPSIRHALTFIDKPKASMDHIDFAFLDNDFDKINDYEIDSYYQSMLEVYNEQLRVI